MKKGEDIVEVFYGSMWEASLLKSILEDNEIVAVLNNNVKSHFTYLPNGQTSVLVPGADAEKAKAIVAQFRENNGEKG